MPLDIEIIEAGDEMAKGLAWSTENVRGNHIYNTHVPSDVKVPDIYEEKYGEVGRAFVDAAAKRHDPAHKGEVPRSLGGNHHQAEFYVQLAILKEMGVNVITSSRTTAENIQKSGDRYVVTTRKEGVAEEKRADFVILASGHWQHLMPEDKEGCHNSPWPAKKIEAINSNQPIAVLGTSLNAVDAILTLAHKAGSFNRTRDGKLHFSPHAENPNFKVSAYSRSGMLPPVLSKHRFDMGRHFVMPDYGHGGPTLDKMYDALKSYFINVPSAQPDPQVQALRGYLQNHGLDDAIKEFHTAYKAPGAQARLKSSLEEVSRANNKNKPIVWQSFLRQVDSYIDHVYDQLGADDKDKFLSEIKPIIAKLSYGIMPKNAEEILAVMESGCLDVKSLDRKFTIGSRFSWGSDVESRNRMPGAEIRYKDKQEQDHSDYFAAMVNASGDNLYDLEQSSLLMKNLFRSGMARPDLTPYEDPEKGKESFIREHEKGNKHTRVRTGGGEWGTGTYFRSGGGIGVDLDTYEVLGPVGKNGTHDNTHANFFTLGHTVTAQKPLLIGSGPIERASKVIVNTIVSRLDIIAAKEAREARPQDSPATPPADELRSVLGVLAGSSSQLTYVVVQDTLSRDKYDNVKTLIARMTGDDPARIVVSTQEFLPREERKSFFREMRNSGRE